MRILRDLFIVSIWTCIFSFGICLSAENRYDFRPVTPRDGMPSNIRCIHAEKRGFVWFGSSSEGLVRYDNYLIRRYTSRDSGEHVLPGDYIYQIATDSLGQVWVLTDKGLARYRPVSDDFFIPKHAKTGTEEGNLIVHCARQIPGGILFGSQNQIFRYNCSEDTFEVFMNFDTGRPYTVHAIYPVDDGRLLCFNRWHGLLLLNPQTGETIPAPFGCKKENTCMLVDSRKRIWLAPYNQGIECYSPEGGLIAKYNTGNSSLSNDIVLCMTENNGEIWIGTDGGGINILEPEQKKISVLNQVNGAPHSMAGNSIRTLCCDSNGNIWAGRVRGGAIIIRRAMMKTYVGASMPDNNGMSDESVLCLHQDSAAEDIWIGTDGAGIDKFNPLTGKFTHYPSTFGLKIASVSELSPRELLLSVFSKGLFKFNKSNGMLTPLEYRDSTLQYRMVYSGQTVNLLQESPGTILFLSKPVYRYHSAAKHLEELYTPEYMNGLFPITSDTEASWFHDQKRIYRLGRLDDRIEAVFEIGRDTLINSVAKSAEGVFWIASDKGICRFSPQTETLDNISIPFFREVRSILCDIHGKIWAGSDNGVFTWLPDRNCCIPYGESEGAIWNEFRPKARLAARDGSVYLGGTEGLLHISGEHLISEPTDEPEIMLMDIYADDRRIVNNCPGSTLKLPWTNKSLTVRVRVLENDILRKRLYRFRIDRGGYQEEIDSQSPELKLLNLVPGNYTIDAICNTPIGQWTQWNRILTYNVSPPWYQTLWFRLLILLICTMSAAGMFFALLRHKKKLLQQEFERQKQKIAEDKVRFLINISHELCTPLTLIIGPLGRLLKNGTEGDAAKSALLNIYRQAQRMKELVNMVLTLRKMETGTTMLRPQMQDMNKWAAGVVEDFRSEAEGRGIDICLEADDNVGERCFDESKCLTILNNLLLNALKHSSDNGRIIVRTQLDEKKKWIRISITDYGCGLKQVNMERLFTRFYQSDTERSGSGIGLSYAKILVEQHGGTIGAAENPDGGAIFYFDLPADLTEQAAECAPRNYLNELLESESTAEQQYEPLNLMQRTLLIVEDDESMIAFLKEEFEDRTQRLYLAKNGLEALRILQTEQIDIIVSDIKMPRMNGYELCRQVKNNIAISHIPVILLTAHNDARSRLIGYKTGADGYLTKPFEIEMLEAVIGSVLRNRELVRNGYTQNIMPAPENVTFSSADEEFLLRIKNIVCNNLQQASFDTSALCQEVGMSRTVLYNKLKLLTGLNIKEYVTRIRIEQACILIRDSQISITEIAERTGFSSSRYFSTVFKQYMGITPSQYKTSPASE